MQALFFKKMHFFDTFFKKRKKAEKTAADQAAERNVICRRRFCLC